MHTVGVTDESEEGLQKGMWDVEFRTRDLKVAPA